MGHLHWEKCVLVTRTQQMTNCTEDSASAQKVWVLWICSISIRNVQHKLVPVIEFQKDLGPIVGIFAVDCAIFWSVLDFCPYVFVIRHKD